MIRFRNYFIVSTISLVLSIVASMIFDFPLSNSWQAGIVLLLVFGPYWIYGWRKSILLKNSKHLLAFFLKFYLILILLTYLITILIFIKGGQGDGSMS